jgi:hypothetical protein
MNDEGIGGVPALFKSFAAQAGFDYEVALETRGAGLDFHLANKLDVIGRRPWDKVVMHGYSTLDANKPRDPAQLVPTAKQMADFLRGRSPAVELSDGHLVEGRSDLPRDRRVGGTTDRRDGARRTRRLRPGGRQRRHQASDSCRRGLHARDPDGHTNDLEQEP